MQLRQYCVFINNYKYALHVSDALCVHHQEHYKL